MGSDFQVLDNGFRSHLLSMHGQPERCKQRAASLYQEDGPIESRVVGMLSQFLDQVVPDDLTRSAHARILTLFQRSEAEELVSDKLLNRVKAECLNALLEEFLKYAASRGLPIAALEVDEGTTTYQTSAQHNAGSTQQSSVSNTRFANVYQTDLVAHTVGGVATAVVIVTIGASDTGRFEKMYLQQLKSQLIGDLEKLTNNAGETKISLPLQPQDIRNLFVKVFGEASNPSVLRQLQ
jgi:hypothetical protein